MKTPLKEPFEGIAQAASRILVSDGTAMAQSYIYGAVEKEGIPDYRNLTRWEVRAIADRSLFLVEERGEKIKPARKKRKP